MVHPSDHRAVTRVSKVVARFVVAVLLAVIVAACLGTPMRTPDVVGVVVDVTELDGPPRRFSLEGGDFVDLDFPGTEPLAGSRGGLEPGTLLLAGEDQGSAWYLSMTLRTDCFQLDSYGSDAGDAIDFDNGLRLPKAPGFDPGIVTDGRYDKNPQGHFCINEGGEVVSYGV